MQDNDLTELLMDDLHLESVISYFAVVLAISSSDCVTKNFFLHKDAEEGKFIIFPWDNDASFGNNWKGNIDEGFSRWQGLYMANNNLLFNRIIGNEDLKIRFHERLDKIINEGFPAIAELIDTTFSSIREDLFLDTAKICSNEVVRDEIDRLHEFLNLRASYIQSKEFFKRENLFNFYCSNPFPDSANPLITFRVESSVNQDVFLLYSDNIDMNLPGSAFSIQTVRLYDDGQHDDLYAGDLVYGNTLHHDDLNDNLIPFTFMTGDIFYYPYNSLFYFYNVKMNTLALNSGTGNPFSEPGLKIGDIYHIEDDYLLLLNNNTNSELDISYCILQIDDYYKNYTFPFNSIIPAHDTLVVTSNREYAEAVFPQFNSIEGINYKIDIGDSIKILSPVQSTLESSQCIGYTPLYESEHEIVINEIRYSPADTDDPGDWIELINNGSEQKNLSRWRIKDDNDSHVFIFPENTYLPSGGYLVICSDTGAFRRLYNSTDNYLGNFDFGFDSKSDFVRLYSNRIVLVDSVRYENGDPWPECGEEENISIELINPDYDNSYPGSWALSQATGTPGYRNYAYISGTETEYTVPHTLMVSQNYPNPFNASTLVAFDIPKRSKVNVRIYNIIGMLSKSVDLGTLNAGNHKTNINLEGLPTGVYIYRISAGSLHASKKMLFLK
jgi:hypothetical protein